MAGNLGIEKNKIATHRKSNGRDNQSKVLIQVLYEHDWIDESGVSKYKSGW